MTRIGIADLAGDFIHFKFFCIQQNPGVINFVIEQIAMQRIAINFLEPSLQLKFVQSCKF